MNNYRKNWLPYAVAVCVCLASMVQILMHINSVREQREREAEIRIEQDLLNMANSISAELGYAESRIQTISSAVASGMTGPELKNSAEVLDGYLVSSPFSYIEYIRKDGLNVLHNGEKFDTSQRVYYKEGIKGKTGIWGNFNPKLSKEILLNFYAPLRYKDEIVGVITGAVGGSSKLQRRINNNFMGHKCYGIICDLQGNVVSSNFDAGLNLTTKKLADDMGIFQEDYDNIVNSLKYNTGLSYTVRDKEGKGLAAAIKIANYDYYVIEYVPSFSLRKFMDYDLALYYGLFAIIGIMLCLILYLYRKEGELTKAIMQKDKELSITSTIANIYNSMHIIDLEAGMVEEYKSNEAISQFLNPNDSITVQMQSVMNGIVAEKWLERVLTFSDLTTLQSRMKDSDALMMDFESKRFWTRALFVVMERNAKGEAVKVIFVTRNIDAYMKMQENLQRKSNVDPLTGLLNRTAYEDNLKEHADVPMPQDFVLVSIDVNGLKMANDNFGHAAGDELLQGAARCLTQCLGSYGNVYRTGGDEFIAILFVDNKRLQQIRLDLARTTMEWHGALVSELKMACGFAPRFDYPEASYDELLEIADKLMYEDKENYYKNKGVDRQGQHMAYEAICASYTKILRVNLTTDSFSIVQLNEDEKLSDFSYNEKISTWLHNFGTSDMVHEQDREIYLQKTSLKFLRNFFKHNDRNFNLYYRRKIKDCYKYVMMEMVPAADYSNEDQVIYLYVKDIDNHN